MAIEMKYFDTKAEASAFVHGVEYANDSAITDVESVRADVMFHNPTNEADNWVVLINDSDNNDQDGHECQNCGRVWEEDDLEPIEDIGQRVAPGEPMPSGECPYCGALCQPEED